MFTLLAKLVRKLSRKERNVLADKLVSLAKGEETPDVQPDEGGQPGGDTDKQMSLVPIVNEDSFFQTMAHYAVDTPHLMDLAMKRGSFAGIIVRNYNGEQKIIIGQSEFSMYQGYYKLYLYVQGYGSSTLQIQLYNLTQITEEWKQQFDTKVQEAIYTKDYEPVP